MDAIFLLLSLLCACVSLTSACSCVWHKSPAFYCGYDMIFRGTAVAVYEERDEPLDHSDPLSKFYQYVDLVYTVRVDQEIMMPQDRQGVKEIRVRTPKQDSLCGTRFPLDVSVVFFVRVREDGEVETGLCDDNVVWSELSPFHKDRITTHIPALCRHMPTPPPSTPAPLPSPSPPPAL